MRTVGVQEWFNACTPEERAAMEAWFVANGIDYVGGVFIIERRCGVTLLRPDRQPNGLYNMRRTRPRSAVSEAPFPWPGVVR
jgi:hypothetical protein